MNYVKKNSETSVLAEHSRNTNHSFNWNSVKILDKEPNYFKRLTSEMLFIKLQKDNSLNIMRDTELLDEAYLSIIDKL